MTPYSLVLVMSLSWYIFFPFCLSHFLSVSHSKSLGRSFLPLPLILRTFLQTLILFLGLFPFSYSLPPSLSLSHSLSLYLTLSLSSLSQNRLSFFFHTHTLTLSLSLSQLLILANTRASNFPCKHKLSHSQIHSKSMLYISVFVVVPLHTLKRTLRFPLNSGPLPVPLCTPSLSLSFYRAYLLTWTRILCSTRI